MALNVPFTDTADLPKTLAVFPLEGVLLLPGRDMPLNIFEPRYLAMVDAALQNGRMIGMVQPFSEDGGRFNGPSLHKTGCAGKITQFCETGDGRYIIALTGVCRFQIVTECDCMTPFRQVEADYTPFAHDLKKDLTALAIDRGGLIGAIKRLMEANELQLDWSEVETMPSDVLVNGLAMICPCGAAEKQALLEADTLLRRAEILQAIAQIDGARHGGMPFGGQSSPLH